MKPIRTIHVRSEGHINNFWDVVYIDGITEKFYACEESPRRESDDEVVWDYDEQLCEVLCEAAETPIKGVGEYDTFEFDYDPNTKKITNLVIEPEEDEDYEEEE